MSNHSMPELSILPQDDLSRICLRALYAAVRLAVSERSPSQTRVLGFIVKIWSNDRLPLAHLDTTSSTLTIILNVSDFLSSVASLCNASTT